MPDEPNDSPEEQKRKIRRRLLKLGVYAIPVVTTIVNLSDSVMAGKGGCTPECPPKGMTGHVS